MCETNAFFNAVCEGELEFVAAQLQVAPELLTARSAGATPLHFAAIHNQREMVDLLLAYGADLNAVDDEYEAKPLAWANEKGHVELTQYLYERGTEVDLNLAAACGLLDRVQALLALETPLNVLNGFGAPLHEAAVWGQLEVAELLLLHGANVQLPNCEGLTPLALAREQVDTYGKSTPILLAERRAEIVRGCAEVIKVLHLYGA
jgi:ankyrin repeat protein